MVSILVRFRALFARYAAAHQTLVGPGFELTDGAGRRIGVVESVHLGMSRVRVTGWAMAERITLQGGMSKVSTQPSRLRADVADQLGDGASVAEANVGFELRMLRPEMTVARPLILLVSPQGAGEAGLATPEVFVVPLPRSPFTQIRLMVSFGLCLIRLIPDLATWVLTRDPKIRARVKRVLGLDPVPQAGLIDRRILSVPSGLPSDGGRGRAPITIILPVYNAFDLLAEVIDRVVGHTDLPWHLVVIEDCSSDDRVRPWLRDRTAHAGLAGQVTLIENAANLGFIGSVNAGLAVGLERGHDVVLLNSDALVPAGWASRLLAPLRRDNTVATVTPMSNDAEIFTVPVLCRRMAIEPGMGDAIDAVAARLDLVSTCAVAPTGVGFCMAMGIGWLRRQPSLDTAFGRGYGEEVDWCQKVRAQGGRHLGLGQLFVEHRGGTSFGSEDKLRLVANNNAIIAKRYPSYDGEVQTFIHADPLASTRLALAIAWAGAWSTASVAKLADAAAVPIYLAHTLGGGADKYLEERIAHDLATLGRPSVVLRVGGAARWQIEVISTEGTTAGATDDFDLAMALLAPLRNRNLVYSCGVGDYDPVTLPGALLQLAGRTPSVPCPAPPGAASGTPAVVAALPEDAPPLQARIEVLMHDFYPLSPSYTLLDGAGIYHGLLDRAGPETATDRVHTARRPDGRVVELNAWQAAWGALLAEAGQITVFSDNSRQHVARVYPEIADRIVVRPHPLRVAVPRVTPSVGPDPVIGVLGNIGFQKGAGVLRDLASRLAGQRGPGMVVVGNVDPSYPLPVAARIHGDYEVGDIPELVTRYGISHWLIPSIWPETFSYTTHEALATGLPVLAFDIGAQGDAVRAAATGHVVPFTPGGDLAGAILTTLQEATLQTSQHA